MEEAAAGDVLLGLRIPQNDAEGAKWNLYAAERGDDRYQYRIGLMYEEGRGVPRDYVRAYMWYSLAVTNGWEGSGHRRDQIAEKMTPDQIAEAQRLAKEWKPK